MKHTGNAQFIITHDQKLLEECCDYFILMDNGKVIKSGYDINDRSLEKYFSLKD